MHNAIIKVPTEVLVEALHSAATAKRFRISASVSSAMKKCMTLFRQAASQDRVQDNPSEKASTSAASLEAILAVEEENFADLHEVAVPDFRKSV